MYYRIKYRCKKKKYRKVWFPCLHRVEVCLRMFSRHRIEAVAMDQDRHVVGMVVAAGPCAPWGWWCYRDAFGGGV